MLSIKFSADLLVLRSTSEQNEIAGTYAHLRGFFCKLEYGQEEIISWYS